ncbi:MAG: class I SAM-dependent methyltransferase [Thermoplasmata archaeon]|nr:class I SAM-dependent methyltransferase [Thermoplasmata archaeon]
MEVVVGQLARLRTRPLQVLELGCGPGSLTARILEELPTCRVVAVDTDPILLEVGRRALRSMGRRVTWVLADLREPRWTATLPARGLDAVVSSLTLHWFDVVELRIIYRGVRSVLRPGGRVINADFLPVDRARTRTVGAARPRSSPPKVETDRDALRRFKLDWSAWWTDVRNEPALGRALAERRLRLPGRLPPRRTTGPKEVVSLLAHRRVLRSTGFRHVTVVWRDEGFRAVVGVR